MRVCLRGVPIAMHSRDQQGLSRTGCHRLHARRTPSETRRGGGGGKVYVGGLTAGTIGLFPQSSHQPILTGRRTSISVSIPVASHGNLQLPRCCRSQKRVTKRVTIQGVRTRWVGEGMWFQEWAGCSPWSGHHHTPPEPQTSGGPGYPRLHSLRTMAALQRCSQGYLA